MRQNSYIKMSCARRINYKVKAQEMAQLYARLRDTDSQGFGLCISCGKEASRSRKNWQGGHYYDKGLHHALAADSDNVHLQCKHCNQYGMNDPAIQSRYGENIALKLGPKKMEILDAKAESKDNPNLHADLVQRGLLPFQYSQKYWEGCFYELRKKCADIANTKEWKVKIPSGAVKRLFA